MSVVSGISALVLPAPSRVIGQIVANRELPVGQHAAHAAGDADRVLPVSLTLAFRSRC
jgi:hypothetical protein